MEEVIIIIESRILLADYKKRNSPTEEMAYFWDGQLRCAQALLNEVAHLTGLGKRAHIGDPCIYCGVPHDNVGIGDCPNR